MRFVCQALFCATIITALPALAVTPVSAPQSGAIGGAPSWAKPESAAGFGFAPLTVTQSGVTYSPAGVAEDAPAPGQTAIADLPAWGSALGPPSKPPEPSKRFSLSRFGHLPRPATWALLIIGFGMIGGALRGLIVADNRLRRLREESDSSED